MRHCQAVGKSKALKEAATQISSRKRQEVIVAVLFLAPTIIGLALFQWIPLGVAVHDSFFSISMINRAAAKFTGLTNYVTLATNTSFLAAFANTLIYSASLLIIEIPLGLALAILLNQGIRGTAIARAIIFAPLVASETVVALLWLILYFPDTGVFNVLIHSIGLPTQPFLISTTQALPSVLLTIVWRDVGFIMLLLLAGLQTIPEEYSEAASIDGAGSWARFGYITLPLLRRTLLLAVFMVTLEGFSVFTPIYLMTGGGPLNATTNAIYYMYDQAFNFQKTGAASAMAVVMMIVLGLVTLVQGRLLRSDLEY
jgi:ABC-type sugar transport system permease subunit